MTTVSRRRLKAGELVEVGYKIDPDCDWNRHKGLAIVIDTDPDPERPGLLEVRYVKERGLPEEQLPIQTLTNSFSCRRAK